MGRLFRQFSFPGGIPSHAAPETPGSIHEGGELGYALVHAYGAAFDNPDLIVACVVGDGEAETGPLAGSWHSDKFLNPATDGAVLPILHLNGYKIANPTVLARIPADELESLLRGYGYAPYTVEGDDPKLVHQQLAATMDAVIAEIRAIQHRARVRRRRHPPGLADDRAAHPQGLDRAQGGGRAAGGGDLAGAPGPDRRRAGEPGAPGPAGGVDALLPGRGAVRRLRGPDPRTGRAGPARRPADGREPARQRRPAPARAAAARLPRVRRGRPRARRDDLGGHPGARRLAARRDQGQPVRTSGCSARTRPNPTGSTRRLRGDGQAFEGQIVPGDNHLAPRRPGDGGAVRAHVPGVAGGLPADRAARPVQLLRGVHPHRRLDVQPARQVAEGHPRHRLAAPGRVAELPADLARVAAGPQRLLPPGPRLHRPRGEQEGRGHPGLPAAGREHPAVGGGPLPALAALRQRHRGRQAAAVQLADHGRGGHPLHPRAPGSGSGRPTTRPARPTWCWPAAATSRPWRRWPR